MIPARACECFIPVKAESERVARKNHIVLPDRPYPLWLRAALTAAEVFERVIIDTDDEQVWRQAKSLATLGSRVQVIRRSNRCRRPETNGNDLLLDWMRLSRAPAIYQWYCTAPFQRAEDAYALAEGCYKASCDTGALGVFEREFIHVPRGQDLVPLYTGLPRSQDLRPYFRESTGGYWTSREWFEHSGLRLGGYTYRQPVDKVSALDINDADDLYICHAVALARRPSVAIHAQLAGKSWYADTHDAHPAV